MWRTCAIRISVVMLIMLRVEKSPGPRLVEPELTIGHLSRQKKFGLRFYQSCRIARLEKCEG